MSETGTVPTTPGLVAVINEAVATLDWAEEGRRPAVVRMARLRPVLAAAGFGALTVEAIGMFDVDAPSVPLAINDVCKEAAEILDEAIGPELAQRWSIDKVLTRMDPLAVAGEIGSGLLTVELARPALAQIGSLITRAVDVLTTIADDDSVLPGLRDAAADAIDALADLGTE